MRRFAEVLGAEGKARGEDELVKRSSGIVPTYNYTITKHNEMYMPTTKCPVKPFVTSNLKPQPVVLKCQPDAIFVH